MPLPPEYRQYAASMAQWFPEVLLLLGAPDLEDHYQPTTARVVDGPQGRTVEVVLQRHPHESSPSLSRPDPEPLHARSPSVPVPMTSAPTRHWPGDEQRPNGLHQLVADYEVLASQMAQMAQPTPVCSMHTPPCTAPTTSVPASPIRFAAPESTWPAVSAQSQSDMFRRLDTLTEDVCQLAALTTQLQDRSTCSNVPPAGTSTPLVSADLGSKDAPLTQRRRSDPSVVHTHNRRISEASQSDPDLNQWACTASDPERSTDVASVQSNVQAAKATSTAPPIGRPAEKEDEVTPRGRQVRQKDSHATTQSHVGRAAAAGRSTAAGRSRNGTAAGGGGAQVSSATSSAQNRYVAPVVSPAAPISGPMSSSGEMSDDCSPNSAGSGKSWRKKPKDNLSISIHKVQQLEAEPASPKFVTRPKVWGLQKSASIDQPRQVEDRSADAIKERIEKKFAQMFGHSQGGRRMTAGQLTKFKYCSA